MHNRTRKLARALEHVPGIDIVAFAAALKSWSPDVDRKVCNAVLVGGINNKGYCVPRKVRDDYDRIWGAIERGQPQRNKTVIDEQDVEGSKLGGCAANPYERVDKEFQGILGGLGKMAKDQRLVPKRMGSVHCTVTELRQ